MRSAVECPDCHGRGAIEIFHGDHKGNWAPCIPCEATGEIGLPAGVGAGAGGDGGSDDAE